jgi:hypothetical protein
MEMRPLNRTVYLPEGRMLFNRSEVPHFITPAGRVFRVETENIRGFEPAYRPLNMRWGR